MSGMSLIIGFWLMLSPIVLDYGAGDPWLNPFIAGALITLIAGLRVSGLYYATGLSVINATAGSWLLVSAFWISATTAAAWNVGACGLAVMLFAVLSATASADPGAAPPTKTGRGHPAM